MVRISARKKHVAIDYDRQQIRLVVFEYVRKAPAILAMHTLAVPAEVDVADASALGQFLKGFVEKLSLRGAKALMCVGRAQAVLKSLTLPPTADANEIASMVQFQTAQELPFGADEAVVDYTRGPHWDAEQTEATAEEGTTVLAAAARLPVLDAARQICQEAGLDLRRLGLRPYANLRAVYHCVQVRPGERIVFVNLTADEAEIDVMCDETLEFSRSVPISAPNGTAEEAEGEKRAQAVRRAVAEVTRSLHSFHAVQRGGQIHGCLVAGATGLEQQLSAALAEPLGVQCELFDPSRGFAVAGGPETSGFGAALGLAAGQAGAAMPFDFLNPKRPALPRDMRKIWAAVAAAAVVLSVSGFLLARTVYLGRYDADIKASKTAKTKLLKTNKQLEKLQDRVHAVSSWMDEQLNWLDQLAHLSNTLPGAERVYLDSVKCSPGRILLVGRAKDRQSVSSFERGLMAMPGYKVRHGATGAVRDEYGYSLKFDLEILISPSARPQVTVERPVGRPADDGAMRGLQNRPPARRERPRARPDRNRSRR